MADNKTKLIILDRDGIINAEIGRYITCVNDFVFLDGAKTAITKLKQAGYYIAIATNQAGIAKGIYSHQDLLAIHSKMLIDIRAHDFVAGESNNSKSGDNNCGGDIDRIVYCASADNAHSWRKPNPGMLLEILADFPEVEAQEVMFVGDYVRDVQAAISAGCQPVLITKQQVDLTKLSEDLGLDKNRDNIAKYNVLQFTSLLELVEQHLQL